MRSVALVLLSAATLLATACNPFTEPDGTQIGIIRFNQMPETAHLVHTSEPQPISEEDGFEVDTSLPVLETPDTVKAGVPFTILVRTFGEDSCYESAGAEMTRDGNTVIVVPIDENLRMGSEPVACAASVIRIPRMVELVFPEPGDAVIQVDGRQIVGGSSVEEEDLPAVEAQITVIS